MTGASCGSQPIRSIHRSMDAATASSISFGRPLARTAVTSLGMSRRSLICVQLAPVVFGRIVKFKGILPRFTPLYARQGYPDHAEG
jgi:hypothetical protein